MVFEKAISIGPATRAQTRRGTFALEPVEALPRLAGRIGALAERALETNPFFLPEFLEPAIQALGDKRLRLASFSDREDLRFFAPVVIGGGQILGGRRFSVMDSSLRAARQPAHRQGNGATGHRQPDRAYARKRPHALLHSLLAAERPCRESAPRRRRPRRFLDRRRAPDATNPLSRLLARHRRVRRDGERQAPARARSPAEAPLRDRRRELHDGAQPGRDRDRLRHVRRARRLGLERAARHGARPAKQPPRVRAHRRAQAGAERDSRQST